MDGSERLEPDQYLGRHICLASRPTSNKTVVCADDRGKAPLRPAQQGKHLTKAFGRGYHPSTNLKKAAPAPNSAAPAPIAAMTRVTGASE